MNIQKLRNVLPNINWRSPFNFSWKQKLIIVIAISLIGLVVVAGSAFSGLNSVNNSFKVQSDAIDYQKRSLTFANDFLVVESKVQTLSADTAESFLGDVATLSGNASIMRDKAQALGYQGLISASEKIVILSEKYFTIRENWAENRSKLGFTSNDGMKSKISTSAANMKKVSFSMINKPINGIIDAQKEYLVSQQAEQETIIDEFVNELEQIVISMDWQEIDTGKFIKQYREDFEIVRALVNKDNEITAPIAEISSQLNQRISEQNKFLDETVVTKLINNANSAQETAKNIMMIAAFICGIITLLSLGAIARQLNIQLKHMQAFLKQVAEGNFSEQLDVSSNTKDEFMQLRGASNHMVSDISNVISKVVDGNEALLEVRYQLKKAVEQLGVTSEEVEQKTQQSTVATQQISLAVNDVAKRAVEVSGIAQSASKEADTVEKVINGSVQSMGDIADLIETTHEEVINLTKSSSKMLGIIDVINGLADQTNLLALNAAIESARAGEAGRGFSVVADEVRALAQKTVGATSNIGEIIKSFSDESKRMSGLMEKGMKLASRGQESSNNAMESFESMQNSIQQVASEMDQVVVAVEEISQNTNEISTQVELICEQSESTKNTRHDLEEHTQHLSAQAKTLGKLTSRFKLAE
ncbi:methyl-accepting chemotaxis protein [Eionea flava]